MNSFGKTILSTKSILIKNLLEVYTAHRTKLTIDLSGQFALWILGKKYILGYTPLLHGECGAVLYFLDLKIVEKKEFLDKYKPSSSYCFAVNEMKGQHPTVQYFSFNHQTSSMSATMRPSPFSSYKHPTRVILSDFYVGPYKDLYPEISRHFSDGY